MEVRKTVIISDKNSLSKEEVSRWAMNLVKFVAPTLATFFAQLALGVSPKMAAPLALLAFYQAMSDLFNKYKSQTITLKK